MDIQHLKSAWQNDQPDHVTEKDLQRMTLVSQHPSLKKIRKRLILESIPLAVFIFLYYDALDGHLRPVYVNVLLTSSVLLFVLNNLLSYFRISHISGHRDLISAAAIRLRRVRQAAVISLCSSGFYSIALFLFLTSGIHYTFPKYHLAAMMLLAFTGILIWSGKQWKDRIRHYEEVFRNLQ